jgi:Family of unknown function (DUF6262)
MLKRNTSGLNKHAHDKRNSALERTELAIQKLLESKTVINFGTVALSAGVSRTWLYNQTEIRERIEQLRNQQIADNSKVKKTGNSRKVGDSSSRYLSQTETQQRVKKLEIENLALRQHLEVVYGMSDSQLVKIVEDLQVENAELNRQLQELNLSKNITIISDQVNCQRHERIDALEMEKAKLLLQIEQLTQQINQQEQIFDEFNSLKSSFSKQAKDMELLQLQLKSAHSELLKYQQSPILTTNLNVKFDMKPAKNDISDGLKKQLSELGIRLNSALIKLILGKSDSQVVHALSVVKDYMASSSGKKSLSGIFRQALETDIT